MGRMRRRSNMRRVPVLFAVWGALATLLVGGWLIAPSESSAKKQAAAKKQKPEWIGFEVDVNRIRDGFDAPTIEVTAGLGPLDSRTMKEQPARVERRARQSCLVGRTVEFFHEPTGSTSDGLGVPLGSAVSTAVGDGQTAVASLVAATFAPDGTDRQFGTYTAVTERKRFKFKGRTYICGVGYDSREIILTG
jgi:hypothetical protein